MALRALLALPPSNQSQLLPPPNATSCEDEAREAWDLLHRVLPPFVVAICCGGLLGNLSVLAVFLLPRSGRRRHRLTAAGVYLANLAASDLVFVLGLPFWARNIWERFHWPFGAALCRAVNGVIKANLFISIFLVVAISRDRYCLLVHPVASRGRRRRRRAQLTCLLIWAAGALLSVPTFLLRAVRAVPDLNVSACVLLLPPHRAWHFARMLELNAVGFLLPLAAILFFNYHILASLRGRRASVAALTAGGGSRHGGPGEGKPTALTLTLVAAFLVCWAPYHFFAFLEFLVQVRAVRGCFWENLTDLGLQWANFFAFLNSCLNPVIYVFVGQLFRTRAGELCKKWAPGVLPAASSSSSPRGKETPPLFWRH